MGKLVEVFNKEISKDARSCVLSTIAALNVASLLHVNI